MRQYNELRRPMGLVLLLQNGDHPHPPSRQRVSSSGSFLPHNHTVRRTEQRCRPTPGSRKETFPDRIALDGERCQRKPSLLDVVFSQALPGARWPLNTVTYLTQRIHVALLLLRLASSG